MQEGAGDGESEIDRIVSAARQKAKNQTRQNDQGSDEARSTSSFSSYDQMDTKGRFKCRACVQSFMSKKLFEKHRKTAEHKIREKKYSNDHAK